MPGPVIYIDHSTIRPGKTDRLRAGVEELVSFIRAREPQLLHYGFYIDEEASRMTVVAVHPDTESVERHMELGGAAFRELGDAIVMTGIEVYGPSSERMLEQLHEKAADLGEHGSVTVCPIDVGFSTFDGPTAT
jgi:quinol monooxygenase YgiN